MPSCQLEFALLNHFLPKLKLGYRPRNSFETFSTSAVENSVNIGTVKQIKFKKMQDFWRPAHASGVSETHD